jgi:glycosyltransferase involved in cell wall biosynthesis
MRFLFVSNYINHHQIPFCEQMRSLVGEKNFTFLQTQPVEEERMKMGWGEFIGEKSYVRTYDDDRAWAMEAVSGADVVLLGWTENEEVRNACLRRPDHGKVLLRMSERIYREGRWKALSPRGLLAKYQEHIRFRKKDVYMLCNGAYVAADFALIHAYPGKLLKWGYFPEKKTYTDEETDILKQVDESGKVRILWAGRFVKLKNPEFALELAAELKKQNIPFHLDMVGGGEMDGLLRQYSQEHGLGEMVSFHGFLAPSRVRAQMEKAHIFLFTSNHLEGWGAVVNEAMNSACAVLAGGRAGAVPFLIRDGVNGMVFGGEDLSDFIRKGVSLAGDPARCREMGLAARRTIMDEWNCDVAAERLVRFSEALVRGSRFELPQSGPLSRAEIMKTYYIEG